MSSRHARHSRQIRLAEVGDAGQRRLEEGTCTVRGGGLAAQIEARYLVGAGVGRLVVSDAEVARCARAVDASVDVVILAPTSTPIPTTDPEWASSLSVPARDVALGAYRALSSLRRVFLSSRS
jgi:hypothetical protein